MKQIRIRLSPAAEGNLAAQVQLTDEEHAAITIAAAAFGFGSRGLSTYMRTVAERAAMRGRPVTEHRTVYELLSVAADEAHMPLGSWVRAVCLEAAGVSLLGAQLAALHVRLTTEVE